MAQSAEDVEEDRRVMEEKWKRGRVRTNEFLGFSGETRRAEMNSASVLVVVEIVDVEVDKRRMQRRFRWRRRRQRETETMMVTTRIKMITSTLGLMDEDECGEAEVAVESVAVPPRTFSHGGGGKLEEEEENGIVEIKS